VAAHVRFIDEHCIDSEEIRSEMQQDIDRLVVELEEQCKHNRTAESLQSQIERLEVEFGDTQYKLKLADENQKRAEALLAARMEEKDQEVGDLNAEIKWFRQEYDSLLLKVRLLYGIFVWSCGGYHLQFKLNLRRVEEFTRCNF